ncbi:MAG: sugar phosphate isomerase/epimerase [Bacteroidetes bacterium]|nr:sugar phosphate isomerase/epimerase [Bacteroidota bacterium]
MDRRDFLQLSGLGLLGAMTPGTDLFSGIGQPAKKARLSVQLYTVRDQIAKDPAGTLKRIADIGFKHVETAFWPPNVSLQQAAKYIKDAGLSVSSSHIELPIGEKAHIMLNTARAYNCKKMIWHGWPEDPRYSSLAGTKALAAIYNEAYKFAHGNGLEFGLHNHWWEYRNKVGGKFVYEVLMEEVNPGIFFEIDTYWVKVAGQDPAAIVAKWGKRAKMLHIKDGPARWSDQLPKDIVEPMTPVGQGTQNFPAIVKAANGNTEWMVVEMDKVNGDVFEALKESYDYLVKNKMVQVA